MHCIYSFENPEGCGYSSHCKDCVVRRSVGKAFRGEDVYREITRMKLLTGNKISEIYASVTASPIYYAERKLVLLVIEDITEQKRYEEELKLQAAKLEAAYRDMESFTYSASHDLRSPLIAIAGFSRVLMEDHGEKFDQEVKELLGIVIKNAIKMEQLLNDLFKFSRVSTKEIEREEIDMDALAGKAFDELKPGLGGRTVDFTIRNLLPAAGDLPMLRQVFVNLLSNALKYARAVNPARVEVGCIRRENENIYYVKDNGVGFEMRDRERLFKLFSRLHNSDEFDGTGIGLVIIKRIIEKHGGRVWAEAEPDKGATFYFSLPAQSRL